MESPSGRPAHRPRQPRENGRHRPPRLHHCHGQRLRLRHPVRHRCCHPGRQLRRLLLLPVRRRLRRRTALHRRLRQRHPACAAAARRSAAAAPCATTSSTASSNTAAAPGGSAAACAAKASGAAKRARAEGSACSVQPLPGPGARRPHQERAPHRLRLQPANHHHPNPHRRHLGQAEPWARRRRSTTGSRPRLHRARSRPSGAGKAAPPPGGHMAPPPAAPGTAPAPSDAGSKTARPPGGHTAPPPAAPGTAPAPSSGGQTALPPGAAPTVRIVRRRGSPGRGRSRARAGARAATPPPRSPRRCCAASRLRASWTRVLGQRGRARDRARERAVDLEAVDRELLEVGERGVAGPEVVDGDSDAELLDRLQPTRGLAGIAHERGLGHFEDQ